jgi:hypothetical protein
MKVGFIRALVAAPWLVAAWGAQAQDSPVASWYVGAAGGASHVSLACDANLACDRTATAWKVYGGFLRENRTGGEIMYENFGQVSAGGLGAIGVTDATVRPRALGVAAVWQPEFSGSLSGKFKVGVSTARARLQARSEGVPVENDRRTEAHWWLAAGLAWNVAPHWDITTDFDWTRAGIHNEGHKQTSDAGAFSVGAAWRF